MVVHQIAREKTRLQPTFQKIRRFPKKKYYNYYKKENSE